nr:MAG TPA: hypothetical protein [Microviridae sp.]
MSSIAHIFLPRTAFGGLLSVEVHSKGILTLLPIALLSGKLCTSGGVFRCSPSNTRKSGIQIANSRNTTNHRSILTSSHNER